MCKISILFSLFLHTFNRLDINKLIYFIFFQNESFINLGFIHRQIIFRLNLLMGFIYFYCFSAVYLKQTQHFFFLFFCLFFYTFHFLFYSLLISFIFLFYLLLFSFSFLLFYFVVFSFSFFFYKFYFKTLFIKIKNEIKTFSSFIYLNNKV